MLISPRYPWGYHLLWPLLIKNCLLLKFFGRHSPCVNPFCWLPREEMKGRRIQKLLRETLPKSFLTTATWHRHTDFSLYPFRHRDELTHAMQKADFKYSLCNCLFLRGYRYRSSPDYSCANNWFFRWAAKQGEKKRIWFWYIQIKLMYYFFFVFCLAKVKGTPLLPLLPDCFMLMFHFTYRETFHF